MEKVGRVAIYMRVGTEEQAKESISIHTQKEKLNKYASVNDWEIVNFYIDDGKSGKDIDGRPEIQRLIEDVKSGKVNNVLVYNRNIQIEIIKFFLKTTIPRRLKNKESES